MDSAEVYARAEVQLPATREQADIPAYLDTLLRAYEDLLAGISANDLTSSRVKTGESTISALCDRIGRVSMALKMKAG